MNLMTSFYHCNEAPARYTDGLQYTTVQHGTQIHYTHTLRQTHAYCIMMCSRPPLARYMYCR